MRYCKLQIACFIIVWYVIFIYIQDRKQYKDDNKDHFFKLLVKSGIISILFDGITAYTVNRFYVVPLWLNNILHMCFLLSLDTFVFVMFRYLMELQKQHDEMVMGFATLIESRDQSTGGHIRRTTKYVELLAKEAAKEKIYKEILTKDYIQNLIMAAPMHDIGKVTIPDAILQKAGKLTTEEYKIMKTHAEKGSEMEKLLQHEFRSMEVLTSLLDRVRQQQVAFQNMDLVI